MESTESGIIKRFAEIVPAEIIDFYIRSAENETENYFAIGDSANSLFALLHDRMTKDEIYFSIGEYRGRAARTIRDWAEIAATFPQETRDEFFPPLFFAHFRAAKTFGAFAQEYLIFAKKTADDNGGRPWGVNRLERHFSENRQRVMESIIDSVPDAFVDPGMERAGRVFESVIVDSIPLVSAPDDPDRSIFENLGPYNGDLLRRRSVMAITFLEKAADRLDISPARREIILSFLTGLRSLIEGPAGFIEMIDEQEGIG